MIVCPNPFPEDPAGEEIRLLAEALRAAGTACRIREKRLADEGGRVKRNGRSYCEAKAHPQVRLVHRRMLSRQGQRQISSEMMKRYSELFASEVMLRNSQHFNRSFQTFDSAFWAHTIGSGLVTIWAALDILFHPKRGATTKELSQHIATWLHEPGPERDRMFQRVKFLYEARSGVVHRGEYPELDQFVESASIARACLIKCLETKTIPDANALLQSWRYRS